MKIELVVFDLAGTTVEDGDAVNKCFREALSNAGLAVSAEAVNGVMGLPKPEAIRALIESSGRRGALLDRVPEIHANFVARMVSFYQTDRAVGEVPGAGETFARLQRAGIKVALNTGFSREIAGPLLRRLGWQRGELIDATVTSDEVARGRPHPDMIRHLRVRLGVLDPARVAKVGDTPADLLEGVNAACGLVVGVTGGTHTREQLEKYPHSYLIRTVADLPALLGV
jgi:phosphonatase-like hydrolase